MLEQIAAIEGKIKALVDEFNMKNSNLANIISDIGKYTNAKEILQNDLNVMNGAIQAYKATVDLLKGNSTAPAPSDNSQGTGASG